MITIGASNGDQDKNDRGRAYTRLFSIEMGNNYFNRPDIAGARFSIQPTPQSAKRLKAPGMLVRSSVSHVEVAYPVGISDALITFLRGGAADEREWLDEYLQEWLSFTVSADDPAFYQYTDLPLDFRPRDECIYLSNWVAPSVDSACESERVNAQMGPMGPINLAPDNLIYSRSVLPTVSDQERREYPDGCYEIELLNAVLEQVECYPRLIPVGLVAEMPIEEIDCLAVEQYVAMHTVEEFVERDHCMVNFDREPSGKYIIRYKGSVEEDEAVLFPAADADCLCFIDIFLSAPKLESDGTFPVLDLFGENGATFDHVRYVADFESREAFWNYLIMLPPGDALLDAKFYDQDGKHVEFWPAAEVAGPGGRPAISFRSKKSYVLQDRPSFWMELRGRLRKSNGITTNKGLLVSALPTPNPSQLTPLSNSERESQFKEKKESTRTKKTNNNTGVANIYVYL